MNKRLFTSEAVSEGHPDKVADQISDAILDKFMALDKESHVAVETMVTTGQVIIAGEVSSKAYVDIQGVVRDTIRRIGYRNPEYGFDANSCGILSAIHEQSPDISQGVCRDNPRSQGAGDQGIMFGFACNETNTFMPATHYLANLILECLQEIRKEGMYMCYLRPDAKSQVTLEFDEYGRPWKIDTLLVSTQHDDFASETAMQQIIAKDIEYFLLSRVKQQLKKEGEDLLLSLFDKPYRLLVNPTGRFVLGGPAGDTGLTGRKIICDTYGGYGAHGGGAFSGKDPSKVDRSAAYAARYIAKNLVANGVCESALIQLSYAIGMAEPVSVNVRTRNLCSRFKDDGELADFISQRFDLTPWGIEHMLHLKAPIYEPTAAYGHFGRKPYEKEDPFEGKIQFFTWERVMSEDELFENRGFEPMDF